MPMGLLEREDINPNTAATQYGITPLLCAAGYGHEGIVGLRLERGDINPNTADTEYGLTLLFWAEESGHEGVVKLLLEREDIILNTVDTKYSRTHSCGLRKPKPGSGKVAIRTRPCRSQHTRPED